MAAVDRVNKPQEKPSKKKPFSWVKKLTNFGSGKDHGGERKKSPKKTNGTALAKATSDANARKDGEHKSDMPRRASSNAPRVSYQADQLRRTSDPLGDAYTNRSAAPTLHTNGDASDAGQSKSATTSGNTAEAAGNSIFSSSNHSARSLTTTLTTIQSTAPAGQGISNAILHTASQSPNHSQQPSQGSTYFSHQYPTTPIASAVPAHVTQAPNSHLPTTYRSATANNLLSDNASVMTLASSHHNRRVGDRRNSADTNASVRAIPPSSQWGGSRESLPLSTLSVGAADQGAGVNGSSVNLYHATSSRPSIGGIASAERQSVYNSNAMSPTAPTGMVSERNSLYASSRVGVAADNASTRGLAGDANSIRGPLTDGGTSIREASLRGEKGADGASIRSSVLGGHGRNNSVANSVATSNILRVGDAADGQEVAGLTNGDL